MGWGAMEGAEARGRGSVEDTYADNSSRSLDVIMTQGRQRCLVPLARCRGAPVLHAERAHSSSCARLLGVLALSQLRPFAGDVALASRLWMCYALMAHGLPSTLADALDRRPCEPFGKSLVTLVLASVSALARPLLRLRRGCAYCFAKPDGARRVPPGLGACGASSCRRLACATGDADKGVPRNSRDLPIASKRDPGRSKTSQRCSTAFENLPMTSKGLPNNFRDLPKAPKRVPNICKSFHRRPRAFPDLPNLSEGLPRTSETVQRLPSESQDVPRPPNYVQGPSTNLPWGVQSQQS